MFVAESLAQISDPRATHDLIIAINRVGVNINQLCRQANGAGYSFEIYEHSMSELKKFRSIIQAAQAGK